MGQTHDSAFESIYRQIKQKNFSRPGSFSRNREKIIRK
jgi:hypothetical protein